MENGKKEDADIIQQIQDTRDALRMEIYTKCSIASLPSSSSKQSNNKTNKKITYSPALSLEFPNFVFYKIHLMVSSPSKFSFSPYLHHLPSNPHHHTTTKKIISYQCYHHQHSFFFSPVVSFMMIIISFFTSSSCSFPSPKKSSSRPTTRPTGVLFFLLATQEDPEYTQIIPVADTCMMIYYCRISYTTNNTYSF